MSFVVIKPGKVGIRRTGVLDHTTEGLEATFVSLNYIPMLLLIIGWGIYPARQHRATVRTLILGHLLPKFFDLGLEVLYRLTARDPFQFRTRVFTIEIQSDRPQNLDRGLLGTDQAGVNCELVRE